MSKQKGNCNRKRSSDESTMRERRGVSSMDCVTSPKSHKRDDFDSKVLSDLSFDFSKSVSGDPEIENQALYEILTEYLMNGTAIGEQLRAYLSSDDEDESSCGSDDQSNCDSFLTASDASSLSENRVTFSPILRETDNGVEKKTKNERHRGKICSIEKRRGILAKKIQRVIDTQLSSVTREVEADASRQSRWHVFNRSTRPMEIAQRQPKNNLFSQNKKKMGNDEPVDEKQLYVDVHDLPFNDGTFVSTLSTGRKLVDHQNTCTQDFYCSKTPMKTPVTLENIVAMMDRILKEEKKRLQEMKKFRRLQRKLDDNKESLEIKVENAMVKAGCLVSPLSSTQSETEIVFGEAYSFENDDGLWNNQHLWERFSPINTKCWREPDIVPVTSDPSLLSSDGVGSLLFQAEIPILLDIDPHQENQDHENAEKKFNNKTSAEQRNPDEEKIHSMNSRQQSQSLPSCSSKNLNGFEVTELSSGENALRFIWNVEEENSQIVELQSGYPHKLTKNMMMESKDIADDVANQKSPSELLPITKPNEHSTNPYRPPLHVNLARNIITKRKTKQKKSLERSILKSLSATDAIVPSTTKSRLTKASKDEQEKRVLVTLSPMTQSIGTPSTRAVPDIHSVASPPEKIMVSKEKSVSARNRSSAVDELQVQTKKPQTPFVKLKKTIPTIEPITSCKNQKTESFSKAKMSESLKSQRKTTIMKHVSFSSTPEVMINECFKNREENVFAGLHEENPKLTEAEQEQKVELKAQEKEKVNPLCVMQDDVSIITVEERDEIELFCKESPRRKSRFLLRKNPIRTIQQVEKPQLSRSGCARFGANKTDQRSGEHNSSLISVTNNTGDTSTKGTLMTPNIDTINGNATDERFSSSGTINKHCVSSRSEGSISVSPSRLRFMWTSRPSGTLTGRKVECFGIRKSKVPKISSPNLTIQVDNETEQPYFVQPIPRTFTGLQEEKDLDSKEQRFILRPTKFWKKKIKQVQNEEILDRRQSSDNVANRNRDTSKPSTARKPLSKRIPTQMLIHTQANASSSILPQKPGKPPCDQNAAASIVKTKLPPRNLRCQTHSIEGYEHRINNENAGLDLAQNASNTVPHQGPLHQEGIIMTTSADLIPNGRKENLNSKPKECSNDKEIFRESKRTTKILISPEDNESIATCIERKSSTQKIHQSSTAPRQACGTNAKGNEDKTTCPEKLTRKNLDKSYPRLYSVPKLSILRGSKREEKAKDIPLDKQHEKCQSANFFRRNLSKFSGLSKTKKCDGFSDPSGTKSDTLCGEGSSKATTMEFAKLEPPKKCNSPSRSMPRRSKISSLFDCDVSEEEAAAPQDEKKSSKQILDFGFCRDGTSSCLHPNPTVQERKKSDTSQRNRKIRDEMLEVSNSKDSLNESVVQGEKLISSKVESKTRLPVHRPERRMLNRLTRNRVAFNDDPVVDHDAKFSPSKSSSKYPPHSALKYKCKTSQQSNQNMHVDQDQLRELDNASSTSSTDEESLGAVNRSAKILWRLSEASKRKQNAQSKRKGIAMTDDDKEHGSGSSFAAESQYTSQTDWSLVSSASRLSSAEKKLTKRLTNDLKILKRIERKRTVLGLEKSQFKTADIENSLKRLKSIKQAIQDREKSSVNEKSRHTVDIGGAVSLSSETNSILTKERDSSAPLAPASRK